MKLTPKQWAEAEFIGIYRRPQRPNQRIPVRRFEGRHYDLLGHEIDLTQWVLAIPTPPKEQA